MKYAVIFRRELPFFVAPDKMLFINAFLIIYMHDYAIGMWILPNNQSENHLFFSVSYMVKIKVIQNRENNLALLIHI